MAKTSKINLKLLKQLVGELEASLATAEGIKSSETGELTDYVVELSKAAGLASGIATESSMLVADVQSIVMSATGGGPQAPKMDFLEKILGPLKKDGSGGNTN